MISQINPLIGLRQHPINRCPARSLLRYQTVTVPASLLKLWFASMQPSRKSSDLEKPAAANSGQTKTMISICDNDMKPEL